MNPKTIVPIVTTRKMSETRAFYTEALGFEVSFDHAHYLGLRAGGKGSPEIGFMLPDADAPVEFDGKGIWFGLSVADADREHARLAEAGVTVLQPPADQPWGARSFVIQDPNGVVISISHPIPIAVEFADCVR